MPMDGCLNDPDQSYTDPYQRHEPSGFTLYVVGTGMAPTSFKPYEYRGPNTAKECVKVLGQFESRIMEDIHKNTPMAMTEEDETEYSNATRCHICGEDLNGDKGGTVRDHDHANGKFRGAAHNTCNLA
jgi:hypothetical protein